MHIPVNLQVIAVWALGLVIEEEYTLWLDKETKAIVKRKEKKRKTTNGYRQYIQAILGFSNRFYGIT